jgi:hypothetical protein
MTTIPRIRSSEEENPMGGGAWLAWLIAAGGLSLLAWATLRLGRRRGTSLPRDCGFGIEGEVTGSHREGNIEVIDSVRWTGVSVVRRRRRNWIRRLVWRLRHGR